MKLYSGLVERCFMSCAQDFTSKALTGKEVSGVPRVQPRSSRCISDNRAGENPVPPRIGSFGVLLKVSLLTSLLPQGTCVQNCTDKFLKHSERVGARFAEHNAGTSFAHRILCLSMSLSPLRRANAGSLGPSLGRMEVIYRMTMYQHLGQCIMDEDYGDHTAQRGRG